MLYITFFERHTRFAVRPKVCPLLSCFTVNDSIVSLISFYPGAATEEGLQEGGLQEEGFQKANTTLGPKF